MRKAALFLFAIAALGATVGSAATASEIVYHPVNPTFGGNPLNGSALLSQAQAQGLGVKSGSQGVDLSGLDAALSNLGNSAGGGSSGSGGNSGGSSGSSSNSNALRSNSNAVRAIVP
jgi:curli production assembly/transport component CsgF